MAKKVVLSFDDGRADTYEVAFPILKKYGLTATLNIATDFILHPDDYSDFKSSLNHAMTIPQIIEMHDYGIEIASHSSCHVNDAEDILKSLEMLKEWGLDDVVGFASPFSEFTPQNNPRIMDLIDKGVIRYIRTGKQVRRESPFYIAKYVLEEKTHSKVLFKDLNLPLCTNVPGNRIVYGISVSNNTTPGQIMSLIDAMSDQAYAVFIFHSILPDGHTGIGQDKWYWRESNFDELCRDLVSVENISCECTRDVIG